MTPRITPPIPITLDRPRFLRLDKRAVFTAERTMCRVWGRQINILSVFADLNTLTLNDLAILLHQALLDDDPSLTLEQTQELMDIDKLEVIFPALFEAWNAAMQSAAPPTNGTTEDQAGPLSFPGVSSGVSPALS